MKERSPPSAHPVPARRPALVPRCCPPAAARPGPAGGRPAPPPSPTEASLPPSRRPRAAGRADGPSCRRSAGVRPAAEGSPPRAGRSARPARSVGPAGDRPPTAI